MKMFERLKCFFRGNHRYVRVITDPDGEIDLGEDSYSGEVNLDVCVDCLKLKPVIEWNSEFPFGHPEYKSGYNPPPKNPPKNPIITPSPPAKDFWSTCNKQVCYCNNGGVCLNQKTWKTQ